MAVWRTYTYLSSFFWDSKLSTQRKQELVDWVNGLSETDAQNLEDLLDDAREDEAFACSDVEY